MANIGRLYRKAVKKAGVRKIGRNIYAKTGLINPIKKGKLSTSRLFRDVAMLKSMINSEKKRLEVNLNSANLVGQVNANTSGHWLFDLTPQPAQGTGYNQKTGNSFKWVSSFLDFQIIQQASLNAGIKLKFEVVKVVGLPYTTVSDVMGKYIEPTSFTSGTVYDINSPRDPDYFKNFVVLRKKYVKLAPDTISGQTVIKRISMGIKFKDHHVRVNDNGPTESMGQVFLLITADRGNCNTTTASTITGIPDQTANTAVSFLAEFTHYFYDN